MKTVDPNKRFFGTCKRHGPGVPLYVSDRSCCACRIEQIRARRTRAKRISEKTMVRVSPP
jgi:hypothetical protein